MTQHKPILVTSGIVAITAFLATRSPTPLEPPASWVATMNAPVEPGVGVGDLVLGETTLRECLDRHGKGSLSVVADDQPRIELSYLRGQVRLSFRVLPTDRGPVGWATLKDAVRDPMTVAAAHPEVGGAALTWIQLRAGSTRASTYYRGTCAGGQLHQPSDALMGSEVLRAQRIRRIDEGTEVKVSGPGLSVLISRPRNADQPAWLKRISVFATE